MPRAAPRLLCRVADPAVLASAWADVLANDRQDGVMSAGVTRFARSTDDRLARIAEDLAAGEYRPDRLVPVPLVRPDGRTRLLHVPSVRDRVVERALLTVLTPVIDPWLGPFSYAYRPGLGVADAVQAVARLREEGLGWVARTDIDDCFPSLPVSLVRRLVGALVDDADLVALLDRLLTRQAAAAGRRAVVPGVPQGAPLSPLWTNLVLAGFDSRVAAAGFPVVRYSDDILLAASSREEAWEAMRVASAAAQELGMGLGADKSAVMSFEEGFTFLGEDFGLRYPPALTDHRCVDPVRQVVYLGLQGSRCRVSGGRLLVESPGDQELLNVPSGLVERIVVFGSVGVSAGVRSWALATGVDLVFLSRRGSYLGHAWPAADGRRITRLRAQLAAADDHDLAMRFARAVVSAKLRKQLVLLQRFGRRETAEAVTHATGQLNQLIAMIPDCGDRDTVMGVEGAAAREYFAALGDLVPEEVRFEGRSRRPPTDLINAALSYGYAILLGETTSALCAAGLDPAIGLLHAEGDRRPALALDLMEEFRPMIVDQVVIAAARRSELRAMHGRRSDGQPGVLLTRAGREAIIGGYEHRMLQSTRGALPGFSGSLRRHLYRQAERLAAHLHGSADWTGLSWR
jgi:CRISP-associated protein Cas1